MAISSSFEIGFDSPLRLLRARGLDAARLWLWTPNQQGYRTLSQLPIGYNLVFQVDFCAVPAVRAAI
jgi:hypothetical protein